jgi:hypothetical protein
MASLKLSPAVREIDGSYDFNTVHGRVATKLAPVVREIDSRKNIGAS